VRWGNAEKSASAASATPRGQMLVFPVSSDGRNRGDQLCRFQDQTRWETSIPHWFIRLIAERASRVCERAAILSVSKESFRSIRRG
jgi:hypothetical protein